MFKNSIINISNGLNLNSYIYRNDIYLKGGTLKLGENASFDSNTSLTLSEGSTLDVIDNVIKEYSLQSFVSNNANLAIDLDVTNNLVDSFYTNQSIQNATINLTNINILNPTESEGKVRVFKNVLYGLTIKPMDVYTSAGKFYIEDAGNGYIYYDLNDREKYNLQNVVKFTDGDRIFSMSEDDIVTRDINDMSGTSLIVNGNDLTINGNGHRGIYVQKGQSLSINDVNVINFNVKSE